MTTLTTDVRGAQQADRRARLISLVQRQAVLIALALLVIFGALRYDGFLSVYNISEFLRYSSLFGLLALGMTFVIMTGGIDLSVGKVAALSSVIAALLSPYGFVPALVGTILAGVLIGLFNGMVITRFGIPPFITTLATFLAARGIALILAPQGAVSLDNSGNLGLINSGNVLGVPVPVIILLIAYALGALLLNYTRFGRHVLAIGGNEDAARLMGLPVDRVKLGVYALSGGLAALVGVILTARTFTGLPTEGDGWELQAIASVVVGGTLLTGGMGSVGATLVGAMLLNLVFNILNFENARGSISLSAYWQSVIRGAFLLAVVILQSRLAKRRGQSGGK